MGFKAFLYVGLGGAAGSMLRYGLSMVIGKYATISFPFATFSINIVGSFIIGVLFGLVARGDNWLSQGGGMLLLATGFCGGFTTFSAFALENVNLFSKGQSATAILYTTASVIGGLLLCRLGVMLAS